MGRPLPEQNILHLAWKLNKLPSEIENESEFWINRLLMDDEARQRAAKK